MENRVIIIAEAGVNHNGDIQLAKELAKKAFEAGADYVKFQTFKADKIVSRTAKKAKYQQTSHDSEDQYSMLKKLELGAKEHKILYDYCKSLGIEFISSPFDLESIDFLEQLGIELFKIPSGEITNRPFLEKLNKIKKPIVLSTGMATMSEIEQALQILNFQERNDLYVLHCNTEYPTPMGDVNLKAMNTIRETFKVKVGYSDHTLGLEIPFASVALGAKIIEKHFTLDKDLEGPDHKASLDPTELSRMVSGIRNIELALSASGVKLPTQSELKNKTNVRKSIHVGKPISKGHCISESDLIMLRPGNGISPMEIDKVVSRVAKKDLKSGEILSWKDLS